MRPSANESFLKRAYQYTKENGAMTIHELLDALRINPNTGRVSACLPTRKQASQMFRIDKRFKAIKSEAKSTSNAPYTILSYMAVTEGEEQ